MDMTRRIRSFAAIFAMIGVLFAQLAVAAYACPMAGGVADVVELPLQEGGCNGMPMDADRPALCQAHCQQGNQSLDKPSVPLLDQLAPMPVLGLPGGLLRAVTVAAPGEQRSLLARATAPSLAVRNCCFRI